MDSSLSSFAPSSGNIGQVSIVRDSSSNTYRAETSTPGSWSAATLGAVSGLVNLDSRVAMTTNAAIRGVQIEEVLSLGEPQDSILDDALSTKFFIGSLSLLGLYVFYRLLEKYR